MSHVRISGTRVDGSPTRQHIRVDTPSRSTGNMPYVQIGFTGYRYGWDDANSNQYVYGSKQYTDIGDDRYKEERIPRKDTVGFEINLVANQYHDTLAMFDAIRNHFDPHGVIEYDLSLEQTGRLEYVLPADEAGLGVELENKEDKISNFVATFNIFIQTYAAGFTDTEIVEPIDSVVTEIDTEINSNESEESITKTIDT